LILIIWLAFSLIFEIKDVFTPKYDVNYPNMHDIVFNSTDIDVNEYSDMLVEQLETTNDHFAKGDTNLILARINDKKKDKNYEKACEEFKLYEPDNLREQAIIYETLASLNCKKENRKDKEWIEKAADNWEQLGKQWRADIILNKTKLIFETSEPEAIENYSDAKTLSIGSTYFTVDEGDTVVTQEERVLRDWLSRQIDSNPFEGEPLVVFSEKDTYSKEELRKDIGWHEGGRLKDLIDVVNITHSTAIGILVARNENGKWYAANEQGIFMFSVPEDKIDYPTNRFIRKDLVMIIDTHGVNMPVEEAIDSEAKVVIGCCDYPGKIKAALYLSEKGINVICNTDRFLELAMGHNSKILGSPHMVTSTDLAMYGGNSIILRKGDKVVVTNTNTGYPSQYYDTPYRYFNEINKTFEIDVISVNIEGYNQTQKVFDTARREETNIVGFRVFNSYDYNVAKEWLNENEENVIVLFHSSAYPYGKLLAEEYPAQTSFDDPNPIILE